MGALAAAGEGAGVTDAGEATTGGSWHGSPAMMMNLQPNHASAVPHCRPFWSWVLMGQSQVLGYGMQKATTSGRVTALLIV